MTEEERFKQVAKEAINDAETIEAKEKRERVERFEDRIKKSFSESCYLEHGITQC